MALKKYVEHFFKVIYLHRVHPHFCWGGLNLPPNFQKRGPERISSFRRRLLEKRSDFFQELAAWRCKEVGGLKLSYGGKQKSHKQEDLLWDVRKNYLES